MPVACPLRYTPALSCHRTVACLAARRGTTPPQTHGSSYGRSPKASGQPPSCLGALEAFESVILRCALGACAEELIRGHDGRSYTRTRAHAARGRAGDALTVLKTVPGDDRVSASAPGAQFRPPPPQG